MWLFTFLVVFILNGISAEAPINPKYLPPPPPFQGYPPSRPNPPANLPPQVGSPFEEDLESIVVDAPQFGRTASVNQEYGAPAVDLSNARSNNKPSPASVQQKSNPDASFTHFNGPSSSYRDTSSFVYNGRQNNYARTNQHEPNAFHTLATFNNLPPYQEGSRSAPNQLAGENIQPNTKASYSHLGTSINASPAVQSLHKDQYHHQSDVNDNSVFNSHRNQLDLVSHVSHSKQSINNQYLPPSRSLEQKRNGGYSYDRPSIPFNF